MVGSFSGKLADQYGYSLMGACGSLVVMASLVLASFSTEFWHLLITQGFLFGLGISIAYFPALSIIAHWFEKKRGLATGIAVSGSGIGGLAMAPLTRVMITNLGWAWSLRISGLAGGAVVFVCALLLRRRLPPSPKGSFDFRKLLKDKRFIIFFVASIFNSFGYFIPFFFIPAYAVQQGLTTTQGALLVGILNAASAVGRISLGFLADYFGPLETLASCLTAASISVFVIWPFSNTFGLLLFFVLVYGFFIGGLISLIPNVAVSLFGTKDIGTVTGMIYTGTSLGNLFGPACAGLLINAYTTVDATGTHINFIPAMMFTASTILVGASFVTLTIAVNRGCKKAEELED